MLAAESLSALRRACSAGPTRAGMCTRPGSWKRPGASCWPPSTTTTTSAKGCAASSAERSYERSLGLTDARHRAHASAPRSADVGRRAPGGRLVYNPLGWSRDAVDRNRRTRAAWCVVATSRPSAIAWSTPADAGRRTTPRRPCSKRRQGARHAAAAVRSASVIDRRARPITQIIAAEFPDGAAARRRARWPTWR